MASRVEKKDRKKKKSNKQSSRKTPRGGGDGEKAKGKRQGGKCSEKFILFEKRKEGR